MPELPEVEGLSRWLADLLSGRTIYRVRMRSVAALKTYDPPLSALESTVVRGTGRRGKYLALETNGPYLVVHLSRAGWVRWREEIGIRKPAQRGPLVAEILFDQGVLDITEQGHEKRLAIWVVRSLGDVPQISELGPEALDPALDLAAFAGILQTQAGTVKSVLANQHAIAGIGNAYSDEILHAAQVSPFTRAGRLDEDQIQHLFSALKTILTDAVERAAGLSGPELKDDKRAHFKVHARTGEPCRVCGDTIREVWASNRSFQYCPGCQSGGRIYADRRLSKILK
jgi:formamidopyrimidine-DNA glycosylase